MRPLLLLLSLLLPLACLLSTAQGEEVVDQNMNGIEAQSIPSALAVTESAKKKTMSKEDRANRRLLRKKKRRLRQLREEIRRMGGVGGRVKGLSSSSRDEKWQRRMLTRMDKITSRLDRLEELFLRSTSPEAAANRIEAENIRKMDRHLASVARSLNGEPGMACASHRDCRPGRCCHRSLAPAAGAAAVAAATPVCVRHDLTDAAGCSDSCQCTQQLQCFAAKGNSTPPFCKRADSTDILTGTYFNDQAGIF